MAVRRIAMLTVVVGFALCGCESQTGPSDENTLPPDAIADLNAWDPGVRDPGFDPGADPGTDPGADDPGADDGDSGPIADPGADPGWDPGTDPGGGAGQVAISPALVDFGYVRLGESANSTVRIRNVGTGTLALSRFRISGTPNVVADLEPEGVVTADGITYEPAAPIEVAPGGFFDVTLTFSPVNEAALEGELHVWTDDPAHPDGNAIFLIGNRKRACIRAIPAGIDYGIVTVGAVVDVPVQIESCGQLDLTVSAITLDVPGSEGGAGLSLDFAEFPGGTAPSSSAPVVIPSGTRATFRLWYAPEEPSPTGSGGIPQPLDAQIAVASNGFSGDLYVPVSAAAVSTPCAVPVIDVVEDGDLFVGDVIHLTGSRSVSPFAAVDSWMWSVAGPPGAPAAILPYAAQPDVILPLGAAGTYTVSLQVGDADGNPSCSSAEVSLTAIPALRALVALSWRPASGVTVQSFQGPDVDLHVLHPNAAGPDRDDDGQPDGWYDDPWDCYWFNPSPDKAEWGSSDLKVDDRVVLVETSEDGLVPEVVRIGMACPTARTYRIGAHFYDDGGLGAVDAEVHVWDGLGGGISTGVRLSERDLWEAATLACPAGTIATPSSPVIKKDYVVDVAGGAR